MILGEMIRERRRKLGLTQDQLAALVGISKPYLSNVETGRAKNPPSDPVMIRLERSLGFGNGELLRQAHLCRMPLDIRQEHEMLLARVEQLRRAVAGLVHSGQGEGLQAGDLQGLTEWASGAAGVRGLAAGAPVPLVNTVLGGYPRHFADLDCPSAAGEYVRCPDVHDPRAFAARVVGEAMEPNYREGDIVLFSPAAEPRSGDDCFIRFADGAATTFKRFYQDDADTVRLQPLNARLPSTTHTSGEITGIWPAVFRIERVRSSTRQ